MSSKSENEQEVIRRISNYARTELIKEGLLAYSQGQIRTSDDIGLIIISKNPNARSIRTDNGKWVITMKHQTEHQASE